MEDSSQTVKLIIKNISSRIDSFPVEFELSKTVGELKSYLSNNYPNNPSVSNQKLIFGGRLLQDEALLDDVFKMVIRSNILLIFTSTINPLLKSSISKANPQFKLLLDLQF
jgi:hypothetical protein